VGDASPRFVGVGHTPAPVDESVLSPAADGDDSDDSGDDDGTPSSSGLNRTQRKNQRHRQKQAQLKAEKAQILLTPPRPTWSVVSSGSGAPGMNSQSTLMELNKVRKCKHAHTSRSTHQHWHRLQEKHSVCTCDGVTALLGVCAHPTLVSVCFFSTCDLLSF